MAFIDHLKVLHPVTESSCLCAAVLLGVVTDLDSPKPYLILSCPTWPGT
jgi:hypothetical protein